MCTFLSLRENHCFQQVDRFISDICRLPSASPYHIETSCITFVPRVAARYRPRILVLSDLRRSQFSKEEGLDFGVFLHTLIITTIDPNVSAHFLMSAFIDLTALVRLRTFKDRTTCDIPWIFPECLESLDLKHSLSQHNFVALTRELPNLRSLTHCGLTNKNVPSRRQRTSFVFPHLRRWTVTVVDDAICFGDIIHQLRDIMPNLQHLALNCYSPNFGGGESLLLPTRLTSVDISCNGCTFGDALASVAKWSCPLQILRLHVTNNYARLLPSSYSLAALQTFATTLHTLSLSFVTDCDNVVLLNGTGTVLPNVITFETTMVFADWSQITTVFPTLITLDLTGFVEPSERENYPLQGLHGVHIYLAFDVGRAFHMDSKTLDDLVNVSRQQHLTIPPDTETHHNTEGDSVPVPQPEEEEKTKPVHDEKKEDDEKRVQEELKDPVTALNLEQLCAALSSTTSLVVHPRLASLVARYRSSVSK